MKHSLNNNVHFNLLHFELLSRESETKHNAANSQMRTVSVKLVNKHCACKLTHHIPAASAAVATAVK